MERNITEKTNSHSFFYTLTMVNGRKDKQTNYGSDKLKCDGRIVNNKIV